MRRTLTDAQHEAQAQQATPIVTAASLCQQAAVLVSGEREREYGDKMENHARIARLWNAYLDNRTQGPLAALDVTILMILLKIARTQLGTPSMDTFVDMAGYAACAGEIAARLKHD